MRLSYARSMIIYYPNVFFLLIIQQIKSRILCQKAFVQLCLQPLLHVEFILWLQWIGVSLSSETGTETGRNDASLCFIYFRSYKVWFRLVFDGLYAQTDVQGWL